VLTKSSPKLLCSNKPKAEDKNESKNGRTQKLRENEYEDGNGKRCYAIHSASGNTGKKQPLHHAKFATELS
jgi:hypothetical protein